MRVPMESVDVEGRQVWPTLVDMHTHLDKGQVLHRVRATGSLDDAARETTQDHARWTAEDLARRMGFALRCAYVHGVSVVRTHIDWPRGGAKLAFDVFGEFRREWAGRIELQAVALVALDAYLEDEDEGERIADLTATYGAILGGVTDAIARDSRGTYAGVDEALDRLLGLAAQPGLDVDLHVDQTADPAAFALPAIAQAVLRNRFEHRVVCGHCVNLALQTDVEAARVIALAREAGLAFVTLPTPMMYLMDRIPGRTPRWRGVTLAQELRAAGVSIAIAGDNCRDAWYPYGDHDMVDTLRQAVRVFQMDDTEAVALAGPVPADIVRARSAGRVRVGLPARLILFSAGSYNEIICRPQTDRIVLDRGQRVAMALPQYEELLA
jgi:cytosine/creatinine deaminase